MKTDPRVFISFDFDHDEKLKILFAGQAKNSRTPFNIEDWSSKSHLPQNQWEKIIEDKINRSNMVLVLVGKNTSSASGVAKEISFAHKNDVPVFGVYIDGASLFTLLPTGLNRNRIITWDWNDIADAIDQLMGEGKNRQ